jgi:hypothetical protein
LAYFVGGIGRIIPLSLAVWRKQPAIIRLLIAYGAHVNQEASAQKRVVEGYTCSLDRSWVKPLDIAIAVGKAELVKILVEQGARTSSLTYPRAAKQLWGMDLIRYICEHSSENPFQPVNAHFFQYSPSLQAIGKSDHIYVRKENSDEKNNVRPNAFGAHCMVLMTNNVMAASVTKDMLSLSFPEG